MSLKENIRNNQIHNRLLLSQAHIERLSDNFLSQWIKFSKLVSYSTVAVYYPFNNEGSTLQIISYLHQKNKNVLLPVVKHDRKKLLFAKYHPSSMLKKNQLGIFEPVNKEYVNIEDIDIVLVPCVAFNKKLYRVGMGGGFYDQTFSKKTSIKLVGLAYSFQMEDDSFEEEHDVQMDFIITQKEILTN